MKELIPDNELRINQEAKKLLGEGPEPQYLYTWILVNEALQEDEARAEWLWPEIPLSPWSTREGMSQMETMFPEMLDGEEPPSLKGMSLEEAKAFLATEVQAALKMLLD